MLVIQASLKMLKEEESESENEIDTIVNVVVFNKRLSHFLVKYNRKFELHFPEEDHKLCFKAMNNIYKLIQRLGLKTKIS